MFFPVSIVVSIYPRVPHFIVILTWSPLATVAGKTYLQALGDVEVYTWAPQLYPDFWTNCEKTGWAGTIECFSRARGLGF